jgi:GNAT superfamily N-acetyltransferase
MQILELNPDLAIHADFQHQGLGKKLLLAFLAHNRQVGFLVLDGELAFSVQTNAAAFNLHVQRLYESVGFRPIGQKMYDNRTDTVYWME